MSASEDELNVLGSEEEQDVPGCLIAQVIAEVPAGLCRSLIFISESVVDKGLAHKWMVANPTEMAKRVKQKQYRENAKQRKKDAKEAAAKEKKGVMVPSGSHKEKRQAKVTDDESSDTDMPASKRKRSSPDSVDGDVVNITAYIHVLCPSPPCAAPKNQTQKPEDDYVQKGPFKFQSDDSYDAFLTNIAVALPCPSPDYIVAAKMTWKPQKPLKAPLFPLGGKLGFFIMVKQVAAKKGDGHVIILTMPAPTKPVEEQPVCLLFIFLCPH